MVVDNAWIDYLVASKLIYQNGEHYEYVNERDVITHNPNGFQSYFPSWTPCLLSKNLSNYRLYDIENNIFHLYYNL